MTPLDANPFIWTVTLVVLHILVAYSCAYLFCTAPDWVQKLVLAHIAGAALVMVGFYAAELAGFDPHWMIRKVAFEIEHVGVVLYVFRLVCVARVQCKTSSRFYRL